MTESDLIYTIGNASFSELLPLEKIQIDADVIAYAQKGYPILITYMDFVVQYPTINPKHIYFLPSISTSMIYYDKDALLIIPFRLVECPELCNEQLFLTILEDLRADIKAFNFHKCFSCLPDRMKIEYLNILTEAKGVGIPCLYEIFCDVYSESDFGCGAITRENLNIIFAAKSEKEIKKTKAFLSGYPKTLTIYRGEADKSTSSDQAYSWTLDINVANFFATRHGTTGARIITGTITKDMVLDVITSRNEKEVLVFPEQVTIVDTLSLYGIPELSLILPSTIKIYQDYRDRLVDLLVFSQQSDVHGKLHCARVLLLTQILAERFSLPISDRKILAAAAIFHDAQRVNDCYDVHHGKDSMLYYTKTIRRPDPTVEFLIEYHCLPDKEGYAKITSPRVERLFKIFKDADALDRVRFGINNLDVTQLRYEESKKLGLVARLCLEQVKI